MSAKTPAKRRTGRRPRTWITWRTCSGSLRSFPLLDGYRGRPKADVAALEDAVLRVGALVEAHPEIAELDCNPVMVLADGAVVVDARIRVEAVTPWPPMGALRH